MRWFIVSVSLRTLGFYNCYMNGNDNNKEFFNGTVKYFSQMSESRRT